MFDIEILNEDPNVFTHTESDTPAYLSVDPETHEVRLTYQLVEDELQAFLNRINDLDSKMQEGDARVADVTLQITMPLRNVILGEVIDNDESDDPAWISVPIGKKPVIDALKSDLMSMISELNKISYI